MVPPVSNCVPPPGQVIGCDVGKTEIVVFNQSTGQHRTLPNDPKALAEFAASLPADCLVVCEATGGYEAALLLALYAASRAVHRADARKVKAFIRSFGTLGKTDHLDAEALARYGLERHAELARWQPPAQAQSRLQALVLLRRDLVADLTAWNNRSKAPQAAYAEATHTTMVAVLTAEIDKINNRIKAVIDEDDGLKQSDKTLREVSGIGPTVSAGLIALMPELGRLDRREVASLAGVAPHPRQSGQSNAYRSTRGGRPEVRRLLFMAALAASRSKSNLAKFYKKLIENGKKPIVALTAMMRKIIVIANAKIRDQQLKVS
jgi:transposase